MNSLFVSLIAVALLYAGYRIYGSFLDKLWSIDSSRKTPANELDDGVDYVPAKHWLVLFGHHFSSIAGAGPIIGPVIAAAIWGWFPALLWIIIGSIFMGGVHDFSALVISLRNRGKSIADVTEAILGRTARIIFAVFLWLALILVVAVFSAVTAKTLINEPKIVVPTFGLILVAVLAGKMMYSWKIKLWIASVAGLSLLGLLIFAGIHIPVILNVKNPLTVWILILLAYSYIASVLPVNLLLQPRDYLSAYVLFFSLIAGYAGILITRPQMHAPAFIKFSDCTEGSLWPMMVVMIACGAISGFHSLVATGTTSKQIASEKDARVIGYGSMILEGMLACLSLVAVCAGLYWTGSRCSGLVYPELLKEGDWIGTFAKGFGQLVKPIFGSELGIMIAIMTLNSFVMTTLDTATRINRYITEELFGDAFNIKFMRNRYVSTGFLMIFVVWLALGNWKAIWPVFGASNQLIASLTLLVITAWLISKGKKAKYTLYPGIFVMITTVTALVYQAAAYLKQSMYVLSIISAFLLVLAFFMVYIAIAKLIKLKNINRKEIMK